MICKLQFCKLVLIEFALSKQQNIFSHQMSKIFHIAIFCHFDSCREKIFCTYSGSQTAFNFKSSGPLLRSFFTISHMKGPLLLTFFALFSPCLAQARLGQAKRDTSDVDWLLFSVKKCSSGAYTYTGFSHTVDNFYTFGSPSASKKL